MSPMTDLSLITPTEFTYAHLTHIQDARFIVFDVMHLFSANQNNDQHTYVRGLVEKEFAGELPEATEVVRVFGNNAQRAVRTYKLTHTQVMQLMSRATGPQGQANRRKVRCYIEALEALVLQKQAEIDAQKAQHVRDAVDKALLHDPRTYALQDISTLIAAAQRWTTQTKDKFGDRIAKSDKLRDAAYLVEQLAGYGSAYDPAHIADITRQRIEQE